MVVQVGHYLDGFDLVTHHVLHFFGHVFDHGQTVDAFDPRFRLVALRNQQKTATLSIVQGSGKANSAALARDAQHSPQLVANQITPA